MAIPVERWSGLSAVLIPLLIGLLAPASASAQQQIVPVRFSFSDPGARSLGLGGAFVALADDATAAFANPAGLVQLLRPEISIEGRSWSYSTPYTEGGRATGLPTGLGIDTTAGLRTAISEYDVTGPSYLSVAFPRGDWSLALFRHRFANIHFRGATQGLFGGPDCCPTRFIDEQATTGLDIVNFGFSAAYRVNDRFNLGLGLVYYDVSIETNVALFLTDDDSNESLFALNSYLPARSVLSQRNWSDATDWTLTGGFLWRLSDSWSVGGVYRHGPSIGARVEATAGQAGDFGVPPGAVFFEGTGGPIKLPDVYGLGVAYRALDGRLTVSLQWDRVQYSDIATSLELDDQTLDDADELHLGAEYVFLDATPVIAVRLGAWLDPDHQVRATTDDPFVQALLPRGQDEMHYAAGLGLAMENFQLDLAADFADRVDTLSLSAIYSF